MIKIRATKNLRGITLVGDYDDFGKLQDAVYVIADPEYNEILGYESCVNILLSLAYDVRHAKMGSRETEMVDNGSSGWNLYEDGTKKLKSLSKENLYYRVNITMVTAVAIVLSLGVLKRNYEHKWNWIFEHGFSDTTKSYDMCKNDIERAQLAEAIRRESLQKSHKKLEMERGIKVVEPKLDTPSAKLVEGRNAAGVLTVFANEVWKVIADIITPEEVISLQDEYEHVLHIDQTNLKDFLYQYLDQMDIQYISARTKKERIEMLPNMISNLIYLQDDYKDFCDMLMAEAKKQSCSIREINYTYPEIKKW